MCVDTIFPADFLKALPSPVFPLGVFLLFFTGDAGALCQAAFLVTAVVTIISSTVVNIFTLDLMHICT